MLDRIIAVVNDDVIMQSELDNKIRVIKAQFTQQNQKMPPDEILAKQILENLILTKLQLQLAANTGVVVDDETLNETINRVAEQNKLTLTQFREILERDGYSYERFREDIQDEITISRLKQRHVDNRISVSDNEIDNFLATEKHQGGVENEYRLSHILIATPEEATAEEKEQAPAIPNGRAYFAGFPWFYFFEVELIHLLLHLFSLAKVNPTTSPLPRPPHSPFIFAALGAPLRGRPSASEFSAARFRL